MNDKKEFPSYRANVRVIRCCSRIRLNENEDRVLNKYTVKVQCSALGLWMTIWEESCNYDIETQRHALVEQADRVVDTITKEAL